MSNITSSEFSDLFAGFRDRFILISASYVRDRKVAEDIVSEVFTKFWDERDNIVLQGPPEAYLLKMVRNRSLNHLRDTASREKIQRSMQEEGLRALQVEINSLGENRSEPLLSQEMKSVFNSFFESLPPMRRRILGFAKFEGLTYAEIAVRLGVTPRKVKREISSALNQLREILGDYM